MKLGRRQFLEAATATGLAALAPSALRAAPGSVVNDVSQLNPVEVASERRPRTSDEVRAALRKWSGPVSVGGGRYSMGGQIAAAGSLHLDMRTMNRVVSLDATQRVVRAQAGTTWRDVQEAIDPHNLSVQIMQSYSNFTLGGSVSVNCHGRYVGRGPLVNVVRAVQMVSADGEVLELSRSREPELFRAVIGGYGGLGVITEVELDLDVNTRIERVVRDVALEKYPEYFSKEILGDARVVLHNADLVPPHFDTPRSISWLKTDKALTNLERLVPRGLDYTLEKNAIWAITELPGGSWLRESFYDRGTLREPAVVWRNREASLDTASLEPHTRRFSTYLLQEYFVPERNFLPFARAMARILRARDVEALNVSIRHSPPDTVSLLSWAPEEVFAFVLYYKQRSHARASRETAAWTRELIEAALSFGGRYYLPYRLDATRAQFERAYPEAHLFAALKRRVDPRGRFQNALWQKYLPERAA